MMVLKILMMIQLLLMVKMVSLLVLVKGRTRDQVHVQEEDGWRSSAEDLYSTVEMLVLVLEDDEYWRC